MNTARCLADQGRAVVLVLHDICLSLRCADRLAILSGGRLCQLGDPETIYQSGILDEVFGIRLRRFFVDGGWQYYYA